MRTTKLVKPPLYVAFTTAMAIFTVFPESVFDLSNFNIEIQGDLSITAGRIFFIILIAMVFLAVHLLYLWLRKSITLSDEDSIIEIKYGDLLKERDCKRVIAFDECFTARVGTAPEEVKPSSICGQYLIANPRLDIATLVEQSELAPLPEPSRFRGKTCYAPGSVVQAGDDLLVAFARLNEDGCAEFIHRDEYLGCLMKLWDEVYKHCGQKDVAISILGSGLTRFNGGSCKPLSQQELLQMIIWSYKLSAKKIKCPNKLRIVCKRTDGFSLNKITC